MYLALSNICSLILVALITAGGPARNAAARPTVRTVTSSPYELRFYDIHTGKRLDVVYRNANGYRPRALARLNSYLRDRRTGQIHAYDPQVFDLLHDLLVKLGKPHDVIDVICGYRTPWTNAMLHRTGHHVALHSLHMKAEAIDIRIPGVPIAQVRNAALALRLGGVGYYPEDDFVHVDVGRVRRW